MSSKSSSKNAKKRKTGTPDPNQHRLDRFLSSQTSQPKDDPMQLDSQPTLSKSQGSQINSQLGTFRQQSLLPTIIIHNLNPSRPKELPAEYLRNSWEVQKSLILAIFSKHDATHLNYVTVSKMSENLCRFGKAETVYQGLSAEIENHVKTMKKELLSVPLTQALLSRLNLSWKTYCSQLSILKNVFMELDRCYVLPNTKFSSIVQLGKRIFSDTILDVAEFRNVVVAEVLKLIKDDRDNKPVDIKLLKDILHMLLDLSFYTSDFEPKFLKNTNQYYKDESDKLVQTLSVPEYIQHVSKRCKEESETRITNYLDAHTRQALTLAVTNQLVYSKASLLIKKGFKEMMDNNRYEPLKTFYGLLEQSPSISILRHAFGEYIKEQGVELIKNTALDSSMIVSLLKFKKRIDKVLRGCFNDDISFANASKEGFEFFINTRGNKPAELLAKFIDSRLKVSTKKQRDVDLSALDNALVLFRYIQGKDAFEAYYKRFLAKRLLLDRSSSKDLENHVLEQLKHECGHDFTKNFENMFNDIQVSADLGISFKEFEKDHPRMPVSVKVIAQATWPTYPTSDIQLTSEMLATQRLYEKFYGSKFKGRKLIWQNALSSCSLMAHYPKGAKELIVSLSQAVILLLFNNTHKVSLSFTEIQNALNLDQKDAVGLLSSLSTGNYKLIINESGNKNISAIDKFSFNTEFESENVKVRVPPAVTEQATEETKDVEQKVHFNRQHQLEAAIVRIMKAKKTMDHNALVNELFTELKYPLEANAVKIRIESLIDRDYLARDANDNTVYIYQS